MYIQNVSPWVLTHPQVSKHARRLHLATGTSCVPGAATAPGAALKATNIAAACSESLGTAATKIRCFLTYQNMRL